MASHPWVLSVRACRAAEMMLGTSGCLLGIGSLVFISACGSGVAGGSGGVGAAAGSGGGSGGAGCIDADNDSRGEGCAAADCDDSDVNNWTSCTTCVDLDGDDLFVDCDAYVTIAGPDCHDEPMAPQAGVVMTDHGPVRGHLVANTYAYRGIPYARPPVGDLRWRAPEPADCWAGTRDATAFGRICVQHDATGTVVGDENCLTLNVWTPADATAGTLPVMVFIHGGSNVLGAGSVHPGRKTSSS